MENWWTLPIEYILLWNGCIGKLLFALVTHDYHTNMKSKNQYLKLCITQRHVFNVCTDYSMLIRCFS